MSVTVMIWAAVLYVTFRAAGRMWIKNQVERNRVRQAASATRRPHHMVRLNG